MPIDIDHLDMDEVITNSYKNFHTKGLSYICLKRSEELTEKLYFLDGDASAMPDVVNPHDHRYDFSTMCLAGGIANSTYREVGVDSPDAGEPDVMLMAAYDYLTPLNGGDGFSYRSLVPLRETSRESYEPGEYYWMWANQIHTIHVTAPGTVLLLKQHADMYPTDVATKAYARPHARQPTINDDGLYDRFTADEIVKQLRTLNERTTNL